MTARFVTEVNAPGNSLNFNVTLTYTDWTWPAVHDSMEWELEVESEFTEDAYFWTHQFAFVGGPVGFLGLQARGSYQADANGPIDKLVNQWKVALPLHPEFGTEPNVYYVPPILPPSFDEEGRFSESDDQTKSLRQDVKRDARTEKPRNQGDKGD